MQKENKTNKEIEEGKKIDLQFKKRNNLLPVVIQDFSSQEILIVAYTNQRAFEETLKTGFVVLWSTSRQEIWQKGKTSGDFLEIKEILLDCDQDAIVYKVKKWGQSACHTKRKSCFYRKITLDQNNPNSSKELEFLETMELDGQAA